MPLVPRVERPWFGPNYPSTSAPTRDATGYPVAGTWTGSATYESASNPHRLIPESTQTVGVSEPIRREQGDCLVLPRRARRTERL